MANEPQDYTAAFYGDIAEKTDASITSNGFWRVAGMTYTSVVDPNCPERIITDYYEGPTSDFPGASYALRDVWRYLQSACQYFAHIGGRTWRVIGSSTGGAGLTPPISLLGQFEVVSVSGTARGSRITLKCGWQGTVYSNGPIDPSRLEITSTFTRADMFSPYVRSASTGCVQPGDLVTFQNSVVTDTATQRSRIEPMILKCDFSGLAASPEISDTWTIDVDQDCSAVVNGIFDDGNRPVLAAIYGQRQDRPAWIPIDNSYVMASKPKTIEIDSSDWGINKRWQLLDHDGASCRIRFPIARSQCDTGIAGNIIIERDTGDGYVDITDSFADTKNGTPWFPRVQITGKFGVSERTDIYLGPITGDSTDYTTGAVGFRITYWPEYLTNDDGRIYGMEDRCGNAAEDFNSWVHGGAKPGTVPTATDTSLGPVKHFYCAAWEDVPSGNKANFSHRCAQTECPQFRIRQPQRPAPEHIAQLTSGMGYCIDQVMAGGSGGMAFVYKWINVEGLQWHLNHSQVYESEWDTTYERKVSYLSGAFCMVDENDPIATDDDGNESIKIVQGALFNINADFSALDWESNRWPADIKGIYQRRCSRVPKTQFSETRNATNDPMNVQDAERMGRILSPVYRDADGPGGDIAYSVFNQPAVFGEGHVMRTRTFDKYIVQWSPAITSPQGDPDGVSIVVYATPRTVYGIEDVKAMISIKGQ